jgi:hypothetical protein
MRYHLLDRCRFNLGCVENLPFFWEHTMRALTLFVTALLAVSAQAGDKVIVNDKTKAQSYVVKGDKIYQTDAYGHTLYNKPHYVIEGNKTIKTDPYGHKIYGKDTLELKSGK